jgi:hypothetical protein
MLLVELADEDYFLKYIKPCRNITVGFARLGGSYRELKWNQPRAGVLMTSENGTRTVFAIVLIFPLVVLLVDVPIPGTDQEMVWNYCEHGSKTVLCA